MMISSGSNTTSVIQDFCLRLKMIKKKKKKKLRLFAPNYLELVLKGGKACYTEVMDIRG